MKHSQLPLKKPVLQKVFPSISAVDSWAQPEL
jgi:hypothetical protein